MKVLIFKSGHRFGQFSSQVPVFPAWGNCVVKVMLQFDPLGIPCSHPPKEVGWGPTGDTAPLPHRGLIRCPSPLPVGAARARRCWSVPLPPSWCWDVRWANRAAAPCSEQPRCSTGNFPPADSLFWMVYSKGVEGQKWLFSTSISENE